MQVRFCVVLDDDTENCLNWNSPYSAYHRQVKKVNARKCLIAVNVHYVS